jgi:hypothetical protein
MTNSRRHVLPARQGVEQHFNGVQFVFVEKSGFGDCELVHSTKRGELEDSGWMRFIQ